jgi:hypothetical protein
MNSLSKIALAVGLALVVAVGSLHFFRDPPDPAPPAATETAQTSPSPRALEEPRPGNDMQVPKARKAAESPDPFELIRALAKAAYDGDGRAQYLVGRELDKCEMTLSLVRKLDGDPEATIWGFPESWPQELKERTIAEYRRCRRLLKEDPFAELPARKGGYTPKYWMQRSVDAGYPLALAERSLSGSTPLPVDEAGAGRLSVESVDELTKATMSGDPDVALTIGFRQSAFDDPARTTTASAWMLAACRMGADCGADSKVYPFFMCYDPDHPNCDKDGSVELNVSLALSPERYADAYAQSQAIEEALRSRDSAAIRALLEIFAR